jgi:hypothetical protein
MTAESGLIHSLDESHHGQVLIGISDAFPGENNDLHMYHIGKVNLVSKIMGVRRRAAGWLKIVLMFKDALLQRP